MMLILSGLFALFALTSAQLNATNGKADPTSVKPEKLSVTVKDATGAVIQSATISGSTCDDEKVDGKGTVGNAQIKYRCLNTGVYKEYDYAIACGTQKPSPIKGEVYCQAFRSGSTNKKIKSTPVSSTIGCSELIETECNGTAVGCKFNCSENLCNAFKGVDFWADKSKNKAGTVFFKKKFKDAQIVITPKRLTITGQSKVGQATKWRSLSMDDLCFENHAIKTCYQMVRKFDTAENFQRCINFRLLKHEEYGWLDAMDGDMLNKTIGEADLEFFD